MHDIVSARAPSSCSARLGPETKREPPLSMASTYTHARMPDSRMGFERKGSTNTEHERGELGGTRNSFCLFVCWRLLRESHRVSHKRTVTKSRPRFKNRLLADSGTPDSRRVRCWVCVSAE